MLNIFDDVTREYLASGPDTSISGVRVVRELTALFARCGKPEMIVSDNGTEPTSNAELKWTQDNCMHDTTSRRAGPCRTALSRGSTAACATNCSTRRFHQHGRGPCRHHRLGVDYNTARPTRPWATRPRRPMPPSPIAQTAPHGVNSPKALPPEANRAIFRITLVDSHLSPLDGNPPELPQSTQ